MHTHTQKKKELLTSTIVASRESTLKAENSSIVNDITRTTHKKRSYRKKQSTAVDFANCKPEKKRKKSTFVTITRMGNAVSI